MVASRQRRLAHRAERGTTVVIVVLVITLLTAIGMFVIRTVSQIDQAVGFSRQSAQTNALAELGTTAAMSQIVVLGSYYTSQMDNGYQCLANGPYASTPGSTCYRLKQAEIESTTLGNTGHGLLETTTASDSGSFGSLASTTGFVSIELTEKYKTSTPKAGSVQGNGSDFDVTLTTTANVRPISVDPDPCGSNVPAVTIKKMLRAHTIVPGQPGGS